MINETLFHHLDTVTYIYISHEEVNIRSLIIILLLLR